jgi:hypothetical protein
MLSQLAHSVRQERREIHDIFVGNPKGKRPPVRPGHRWDDSNEMHLKDIGW